MKGIGPVVRLVLCILAVLCLVGAVLFQNGVYEVEADSDQRVYVVNRFTGKAWVVIGTRKQPVRGS